MNTIVWVALVIGGVGLFILMILIFLGNPSPKEPRFLRVLRINMFSEMLALIGHCILNPRLLSYRATKAEKAMPLPGDELVTAANSGNTYAVTIESSPESIWPWLVQMGDGRASWYCWSPMHELPEYRHHVSTYSIHPEWQNLKVGDILTDGDVAGNCNETRGAWRVMEMKEGQSIVFFSARDFIEGFEFDPKKTRPKKIYGITSWVFYLYPLNETLSRLLIRVRAEMGPKLLIIVARLVFGFGDAVFERTILDGIKTRVENRTEAALITVYTETKGRFASNTKLFEGLFLDDINYLQNNSRGGSRWMDSRILCCAAWERQQPCSQPPSCWSSQVPFLCWL